jgi:hypothetical protein
MGRVSKKTLLGEHFWEPIVTMIETQAIFWASPRIGVGSELL